MVHQWACSNDIFCYYAAVLLLLVFNDYWLNFHALMPFLKFTGTLNWSDLELYHIPQDSKCELWTHSNFLHQKLPVLEQSCLRYVTTYNTVTVLYSTTDFQQATSCIVQVYTVPVMFGHAWKMRMFILWQKYVSASTASSVMSWHPSMWTSFNHQQIQHFTHTSTFYCHSHDNISTDHSLWYRFIITNYYSTTFSFDLTNLFLTNPC